MSPPARAEGGRALLPLPLRQPPPPHRVPAAPLHAPRAPLPAPVVASVPLPAPPAAPKCAVHPSPPPPPPPPPLSPLLSPPLSPPPLLRPLTSTHAVQARPRRSPSPVPPSPSPLPYALPLLLAPACPAVAATPLATLPSPRPRPRSPRTPRRCAVAAAHAPSLPRSHPSAPGADAPFPCPRPRQGAPPHAVRHRRRCRHRHCPRLLLGSAEPHGRPVTALALERARALAQSALVRRPQPTRYRWRRLQRLLWQVAAHVAALQLQRCARCLPCGCLPHAAWPPRAAGCPLERRPPHTLDFAERSEAATPAL